ncbi:D-alanyl-D-alanine carboxypeptidase family protein [Bacillus sp. REN3]|uniref:D-alanyl-D-alanine carboxypeptidase family protein n=1 Tax=Bacillus sp. REN3 TaxID=2802440 RepID=UPI001AEDDB33|nr:D-alanyl-D-alanine carboxypeptidase family protein [Bacillus sp. REN3]
MNKIIMGLIMSLIIGFHSFAEPVKADETPIQIASEAAVLMDSQSGAILYGKNEDAKMYPASLTKIATAIYAIEKGNLDEQVNISEYATKIDGTKVYLNQGEQVTLKKLILGMMVNSGNDAALAIAIHLDGSLESYSKHVNEFLKKEVGVKNTHFTNPHGLFNENHYTTAEDLGRILNYAMKNKEFREIFGTKKIDWQGESWSTTLLSHHRILKGEIPYEGVTGGKTGFVDESKQTLATTADNGKVKLSAILLKSESKRKIYDDTIQLFDFGFANFKTSIIKKGEEFKTANKKFRANQAVFVTEPIVQAERKVSPEGMLTIKGKNGKAIQKLQLDEVANKRSEVKKTSRKPEQNGILPMNPVIGGGVFLMAAGFWVLNRKQKKGRRYRSR